ncbi:helix-turn-helix domain-containing protein [Thermodesulfobacteriota bacterium]
MTTDSPSLSFGRYLKAARLEKGIGLEQISRETRIGLETLVNIEKEGHDQLPAEVYVKGFIRTYAKMVDVDDDKAVKSYLASYRVYQNAAKSESAWERSDKNFWPRLLLSFGILLGIMVLSISVISIIHKPPSSYQSAKQQATVEKAEDRESTDFTRIVKQEQIKGRLPDKEIIQGKPEKLQQVDSIEKSAEVIPEKLLLKILTVEETWIKIIVDSQSPREYTLQPGDRLALEASVGYNLLIGNAGGIKLALNDAPVEVPGKSAQVVNIQIP